MLSAGLFLFPAIGAASKQALAPLAIALAAALLALTLWRDRRAALPSPSVGLLFVAFFGYVAAVHLPPAPGIAGIGETLEKFGMLAVVLWLAAAGWTRVAACARLDRVAMWTLGGLALGSLFLLIELGFDAPLHRLADGLGPAATVDPARYNRPAVAMLLLCLPLAGLLARRVGRRHAAVALLLGAAPVLGGDSAAGWLAAAAAALVYAAARLRPGAVLAVGGVLTLVMIVAAPPILATAYQIATRHEIRMPLSFTDRLEIWDHAAAEVAKAPVLGHGLGAVRSLPLTDEQRARYRFHKAPSTHAHNAALQLWVEFGAVGIAAGLALLGIAAAAIRRLDRSAQATALATAAALLVIAMLSFGLWQETWLGLIGVTLALLRLAALPVDRAPAP
ncbi:MAG: O-antigen ligase family protein [Thalassobaculum sp.]|uniref:O-antigen ligase family protein n=1 Tax=Thalassobaculum sp. TaxID=2022740 RepID=UPI0032EF961D